ncbi:hypothetical protein LCGC14_1914790, partial [marine sediment metagenome]
MCACKQNHTGSVAAMLPEVGAIACLLARHEFLLSALLLRSLQTADNARALAPTFAAVGMDHVPQRRRAPASALWQSAVELQEPRGVARWTQKDVRAFLLFLARTEACEHRHDWAAYANELRVDGAGLLRCADTSQFPCATGDMKNGVTLNAYKIADARRALIEIQQQFNA